MCSRWIPQKPPAPTHRFDPVAAVPGTAVSVLPSDDAPGSPPPGRTSSRPRQSPALIRAARCSSSRSASHRPIDDRSGTAPRSRRPWGCRSARSTCRSGSAAAAVPATSTGCCACRTSLPRIRSPAGGEDFVLRTAPSPEKPEAHLRSFLDLGESARISAGYCWPWSRAEKGRPLASDVRTGGWERPWSSRLETWLPGAPPSALWATGEGGFDQDGCVYTDQGFEYDRSGVSIT